jgi:hypothetical protein
MLKLPLAVLTLLPYVAIIPYRAYVGSTYSRPQEYYFDKNMANFNFWALMYVYFRQA